MLSTRPISAAEISTSQNNTVMGLSSRWESAGGVSNAMDEIVTFGLPDNYFDTYAQRVRAVTPDLAMTAGKKLVPAANFAWVIAGDRRRIEAGLRELGMDVQVVTPDGELAR